MKDFFKKPIVIIIIVILILLIIFNWNNIFGTIPRLHGGGGGHGGHGRHGGGSGWFGWWGYPYYSASYCPTGNCVATDGTIGTWITNVNGTCTCLSKNQPLVA